MTGSSSNDGEFDDVDESVGAAQRLGQAVAGQHVDSRRARRCDDVVPLGGQEVDHLGTDETLAPTTVIFM